MNIIELLNTKTSWGRNQLQEIPNYGEAIKVELNHLNKTNLSTKEVTYILYGLVARDVGYTYPHEFIDFMKLQKTMLSKKTMQELLNQFWHNSCDHLPPHVQHLVAQTLQHLDEKLLSSNSTQQIRLTFMQTFILLALRQS